MMARLLAKERILAPPAFNRWLVPPAALAVHLSIGMAYGFSVFWLPLSRAIGIARPAPADWKITTLGWMYTLFFVILGSSAALFGPWVEREGPRKAGVVAAFCWGGGFFISAAGIYFHRISLLVIGSGVIGGCGLGLGYISPVSTLIKWFPDRRGLATGLAIMGFGGGAMIGTPLADALMRRFSTERSVGVWETFVVLGVIYFVAMLAGAFGYRLPPAGWSPESRDRPGSPSPLMAARSVPVESAWRTRQFWLLWAVLCLNVSAGIGVLGMAVPMVQEVFRDRVAASAAAGFAGLLSLFNITGRIFWSSLSDRIGRRTTYTVFFALGCALYASAPLTAAAGSLGLFVIIFCIILTMYGGGFATIPAYLADLFGSAQVSAIHGRLLTAWSTAGILGPVLVNYIREFQLAHGIPAGRAYNTTLYILAGLLVCGLLCNLAIRPVRESLFTLTPHRDPNHGIVRSSVSSGARRSDQTTNPSIAPASGTWGLVAMAWLLVCVPLAWGVTKTLMLAILMFD
jgi:MFS family permease